MNNEVRGKLISFRQIFGLRDVIFPAPWKWHVSERVEKDWGRIVIERNQFVVFSDETPVFIEEIFIKIFNFSVHIYKFYYQRQEITAHLDCLIRKILKFPALFQSYLNCLPLTRKTVQNFLL